MTFFFMAKGAGITPGQKEKYLRPDTVRRSEKVIRMNGLNLAEPDLSMQGMSFGTVKIEVTINEMGEVIYAKALNGSSRLRALSVAAAKGSTFRPTLVDGRPTKVFGILTYRFRRQH